MSKWSYICPCCGKDIKTDSDKEIIQDYYIGVLVACPKCLNILQINPDLTTDDFRQVVIDNKKKRKAASTLDEKDTVCVFDIC